MDWEVVEYGTRDRPAVLALMAEVQGHTTSQARFIWEFERNPVGDTNVFLAIEDEAVIGVSCHNTFRMRVGKEEERVVSFPLNVLTKATHRGRGIFSTLERANEEHAKALGVPFMLSIPNAESSPIFLNRLGWTNLSAPRVIARPGPILPTRGKSPLSLEPVGAFDRWADEIWAENHELDRCLVRDSTYLNWRFVECPDSSYRVLAVRERREVVGYIVTGTTTKRNVPIAYIANALLMPPHRDAYPALRRAALRDAKAPVLLDTETTIAGELQHQSFRSTRYFPIPKRLHLIAKAVEPERDESWLRARPWQFQLGDLDFF